MGRIGQRSRELGVGCVFAVAENFTEHPPVLNGAPDLIFEIVGSQIGTHTALRHQGHILPVNASTMIEYPVYLGK